MRDFNKVSGAFWTGETGKELKQLAKAGDYAPQLLALYLLTCPHVHAIGVFYCPKMYMAHETGLTVDQVDAALQTLNRLQFCQYDDAKETVFVLNMVKFQLGIIKQNDNRHKGLVKDVEAIQSETLKAKWLEIHGQNYGFEQAPSKPLTSPFEGVSKPPILREREEIEREIETERENAHEDQEISTKCLSQLRVLACVQNCKNQTDEGQIQLLENLFGRVKLDFKPGEGWDHWAGWVANRASSKPAFTSATSSMTAAAVLERFVPDIKGELKRLAEQNRPAEDRKFGNPATGEGITWVWSEDELGNPYKKPITQEAATC